MRLPVLTAVLVGCMLAAGLPAGAQPGQGEVLVLGDSYASGEGLPSAEGPCGTEEDLSWGALVAEQFGMGLRLLACSGAEVADLTVGGALGLQPQLEAAAAGGPADLVLLTIGGNDLGFTEIVADCLGFAELQASPAAMEGAGWTDLVTTGEVDRGCDVSSGALLERVGALRADDRFVLGDDGTTGGLADLYAVVAEQTVAEGGLLVVVGYPALFEEPDRWAARYGRRCHGVLGQDVAGLNDVVRELDVVVADEVEAATELTERDIVHVGLVEPYDAGEDDHRLCGAGEPWMNGLTVSEGGIDITRLLTQLGQGGGPGGFDLEQLGARPSGSFHPGTAGHRGTAEVVRRAAAPG